MPILCMGSVWGWATLIATKMSRVRKTASYFFPTCSQELRETPSKKKKKIVPELWNIVQTGWWLASWYLNKEIEGRGLITENILNIGRSFHVEDRFTVGIINGKPHLRLSLWFFVCELYISGELRCCTVKFYKDCTKVSWECLEPTSNSWLWASILFHQETAQFQK